LACSISTKIPTCIKTFRKGEGDLIEGKSLHPTPVEYKSIELDYKLLLERPKKAVKDTLIGLQHQHKNTHMYRKFQES